MYEKIAAMIAAQLGVDVSEVTMQSRLTEDLKADSIDVVAMIMDCESEFGIEISDEALETLKTVGDIVRYIEANRA
jgi:acyl carrier protein